MDLLNITILLALACIPPPMGWSHDPLRFSFLKMDVMEIEAFSLLHQQIIRKKYFESHRLGMQPLSCAVIDVVCQYYYQGGTILEL